MKTSRNMLRIVVVRSKVNDRWNYCPAEALPLLRLEMADDGGFPTADACLAAARADQTIPRPASFEIVGAWSLGEGVSK